MLSGEVRDDVAAIHKRIDEICRHAKFCEKINIHINIDAIKDTVFITYDVSENCIPDNLLERVGMTEEDTHFLKDDEGEQI